MVAAAEPGDGQHRPARDEADAAQRRDRPQNLRAFHCERHRMLSASPLPPPLKHRQQQGRWRRTGEAVERAREEHGAGDPALRHGRVLVALGRARERQERHGVQQVVLLQARGQGTAARQQRQIAGRTRGGTRTCTPVWKVGARPLASSVAFSACAPKAPMPTPEAPRMPAHSCMPLAFMASQDREWGGACAVGGRLRRRGECCRACAVSGRFSAPPDALRSPYFAPLNCFRWDVSLGASVRVPQASKGGLRGRII